MNVPALFRDSSMFCISFFPEDNKDVSSLARPIKKWKRALGLCGDENPKMVTKLFFSSEIISQHVHDSIWWRTQSFPVFWCLPSIFDHTFTILYLMHKMPRMCKTFLLFSASAFMLLLHLCVTSQLETIDLVEQIWRSINERTSNVFCDLNKTIFCVEI